MVNQSENEGSKVILRAESRKNTQKNNYPPVDFKKIPHVLKIVPKNFTNEFHPSMCLLLHGSEPMMITLDRFAQKTILVSVLHTIVMIQNFDAIFSIFRYFTGG